MRGKPAHIPLGQPVSEFENRLGGALSGVYVNSLVLDQGIYASLMYIHWQVYQVEEGTAHRIALVDSDGCGRSLRDRSNNQENLHND